MKPNYYNLPPGNIYMVTDHTKKEYKLFDDLLTALHEMTSLAKANNRTEYTNLTFGLINIPELYKRTDIYLTQSIYLYKDGQRFITKQKSTDAEETKNIMDTYNWINPNVKFLRCLRCNKTPNITTAMKNGSIFYAIRCTDGCYCSTALCETKTDALTAWIENKIQDKKETETTATDDKNNNQKTSQTLDQIIHETEKQFINILNDLQTKIQKLQ